MNQPPNMIARHAYLSAGVKHCRAEGRKVPAQVLQELQRIESRAQAMLTPGELNHALRASLAMQAQYSHAAGMAENRAVERDAAYHMQKLAEEATGMTPDQLEAAKRGKVMPHKGRGFQPERVKGRIRDMLGQLGKRDMDFNTFARISDRYQEMLLHNRDPGPLLREHFGDKAAQARDMLEGFQRSGLDIAIGLIDKRGGGQKDYVVEPSNDDIRRAQIADAFANEAQQDRGSRDYLTSSGINPNLLAEESRHGDVARAFARVEAEEMQAEREAFEPNRYNEDQLRESYDGLSSQQP